MARAITISSLVIRFVVSLQATVCTAMTAALILEKRAARKSDVAYLSIARSINDGPRKVVQLLFFSRSWSVLAYVELWLLLVLTLVMLTLQFSSTILLSDLHDSVVVGHLEARSIATSCNFNGLANVSDLWNNFADTSDSYYDKPVYTVFGEERSSYNISPDASGFSDTGVIRRGYLPLSGSQNRTSVRNYRGSTLVASSRIACVPPQLRGHFQTTNVSSSGHVIGVVDYGRSLRQAHQRVGSLCAYQGCESVPFNCYVPGSLLNDTAQSNYCFIETVGRTSSIVQELSLGGLFSLNREAEPWSLNSSMFLVFRSNLTVLDWPNVANNSSIPPAKTRGEWSRFEVMDGLSFDVSLCFLRFYIQQKYVNMVAKGPTREPVLMWDGLTPVHNTTEVSSYYGADSPLKPPSERGLMDMDILPERDFADANIEVVDGLTPAEASSTYLERYVIRIVTNSLSPDSITGCVFCADYSIAVPLELGLLFSDVIESTGRAAAALHSFTAIISSTAYDNMIKLFNVSEEVNMTTTISVSTPGPCSDHRCFGFISMTTLLGVHLVIVAVITTLYVGQVRYSRCSNTWHAISQLMSQELDDALEQGNNAKDSVITKSLKREGKDDFVKLGLTGDSNRVQVIKYASNNQRPIGDKGSHPARERNN
ncbi:hypothetical protein F5Y19DRAFT_491832 [Xylariaceae sp. FL1651]|nr:hypothetical protein F5Y19DRAFT_491832 [Xylariaceae sp. FL1651]